MNILMVLLVMVVVTHTKASGDNCTFYDCNCEISSELLSVAIIRCKVTLKEFPLRNQKSLFNRYGISFFKLSYTNVAILPNACFNGLSITHIQMTNNLIKYISGNAFVGLNGLHNLDLSFNKIEMLSTTAFKQVSDSLHVLNLNNNQLDTMDSDQLAQTFSLLINLKKLHVSFNNLKIVPNMSANMNLVELQLNGNHIQTLSETSSSNEESILLPISITKLELRDNNIGSIQDNWFSKMKNLTFVDLSNNYLQTIEENVFKNLNKLLYLDLSGNYIKVVPSQLLLNRPSLLNLIFKSQKSVAQIKQINNYAFDKYMMSENVVYDSIDLSGNSIKNIEPHAFCSLVHGKPINLVRSLKIGFANYASLDVCTIYQISNSSELSLELANIKCDCNIQILSSKFDLSGFCFHENGTKIQLKQYKCKNKLEATNWCNNHIYECSKSINNFSTFIQQTDTTLLFLVIIHFFVFSYLF